MRIFSSFNFQTCICFTYFTSRFCIHFHAHRVASYSLLRIQKTPSSLSEWWSSSFPYSHLSKPLRFLVLFFHFFLSHTHTQTNRNSKFPTSSLPSQLWSLLLLFHSVHHFYQHLYNKRHIVIEVVTVIWLYCQTAGGEKNIFSFFYKILKGYCACRGLHVYIRLTTDSVTSINSSL